ncbi:MAG: hypothetical protein JXR83_23345 [Deltaproteobacteria bacterium]|nr:hypothetical protein [Deltaproteobacteria bacterium]
MSGQLPTVALLMLAAQTACPPPGPASRCATDDDCGDDHFCYLVGNYCLPRQDGGAAHAGNVQILELTVSPDHIPWDSTTTVHFRAASATSCELDGVHYPGVESNAGVDRPVHLLASHTFELVCRGNGGPVSAEIEVAVLCSAPVIRAGSSVVVTSQSELESRFAGIEGCFVIDGSLHIADSTDIVDLTALAGLVEVRGHLQIHDNSGLTSLAGLESLQRVTGDLGVGAWCSEHQQHEGNPLLQSAAGLSGLHEVLGALRITGYSSGSPTVLASLDGLEELRMVQRYLAVQYLTDLTSIAGLKRLRSVGSDRDRHGIWLQSLPRLSTLHGLEGLITMQGTLAIEYGMDELMDISSLSGLTEAASVAFSGLERLLTLHGLDNVTGVDRVLSLTYNPVLSDISALEGAFSSGTLTRLDLAGNPDLQDLSPLTAIAAIVKNSAGDTCPPATEEDYFYTSGSLALRYGGPASVSFLSNLQTIECSLYVYRTGLTSLAGLSSLDALGGNLEIDGNSQLVELGLPEDCDFGGPYFIVTDNDSLSGEAVQTLAESWTSASPSAYHVTISGNAP